MPTRTYTLASGQRTSPIYVSPGTRVVATSAVSVEYIDGANNPNLTGAMWTTWTNAAYGYGDAVRGMWIRGTAVGASGTVTVYEGYNDPAEAGRYWQEQSPFGNVFIASASNDVSGVTDAAIINASIVNLNQVGGGTLYLGPGVFVVNTSVLPLSNVNIRGAGVGVTTVKLADSQAYTSSANVIYAYSSAADITDWSIADLTIDGNRANQTETGSQDNAYNGIRCQGTSSYKVKRFRIENIEAKNCLYHGIMVVDYCEDFDIERNWCHDNGYRGIHAHGTNGAGAVQRYAVNFNRVHENGKSTGSAQTTANGMLSGLFAFLENAFDCQVIGNRVWSEPGLGIEITGRVAAASPASYAIFSENIVYDCGEGIRAGGDIYNVNIVDNVVRACVTSGKATGATGQGIHLSSSGTTAGRDLNVSRNQIRGCSSWGMVADTATDRWTGLNIQGNNIRGNGTGTSADSGGMRLLSVQLSTISGNIVVDNDGGVPASGTQRNMHISTSCDNNVVSGNIVSCSSSYRALELTTADNNVVIGNVLKRGGSNALIIAAGCDNTFAWGNIGDGTSDSGTNTVSGRFHKADAGGAGAGTLANAPSAGNPAEWIMLQNASGTIRRVPAW